MRILVADDEPSARKVLRYFLEKHGHEPVIVEDGHQALRELTAPNAPKVVLLDWMMPQLAGPDVCAKLRGAPLKVQPYVIMLSTKSGKTDIAAALDAGADDYMTKPFNADEMLARLRVAERSIRMQVDFTAKIEELESLARRHNLLGEMVAHSAASGHAEPEPAAPADPAPAADGAPSAPTPLVVHAGTSLAKEEPVTLTRAEIDRAILDTLAELGLTDGVICDPSSAVRPQAGFAVWASFISVRDEQWYDLLLDLDAETAAHFYATTLKRPHADERELLQYLAELQSLMGSSLRNLLQEKGAELLSPLLSSTRRRGPHRPSPNPPGRSTRHGFLAAGRISTLSVAQQPNPVRWKPLSKLQENDILAFAYPAREAGRMPIFNGGTVLSARFIDKLLAFERSSEVAPPAGVFEPSPMAVLFSTVPAN